MTNRSLNIEEEQEEGNCHLRKLHCPALKRGLKIILVDDRAQTVEPELRRAIQNRNAKLESDLTGKILIQIFQKI